MGFEIIFSPLCEYLHPELNADPERESLFFPYFSEIQLYCVAWTLALSLWLYPAQASLSLLQLVSLLAALARCLPQPSEVLSEESSKF